MARRIIKGILTGRFLAFAALTAVTVSFQNCGLLDDRLRGEIKIFGSGPAVGPLDLTQTLVTPVYSTLPNWNTWLRNDATAPDELHITNAFSCDGTETGRTYACVHAGEYKKFQISGQNSCATLTAVDALNAFDWFCMVENGSATFYTWGLSYSRGKGLKDLVTDTQWRDNHVIVSSNGVPVGQTTPSKWWSNPVVPLPDNSTGPGLVLNAVNTIYTLSASRATGGYIIDADGIGVVTLNGSQLLHQVGMLDVCESTTGEEPPFPIDGRRTTLCAGGQKFLWIEADITLNNSDARYGIHLVGVTFSRLTNFTVQGAFDRGVSIENSGYLHLWNLKNHNTGDWLDAQPGLSPDESAFYFSNLEFSEIHSLTQSLARIDGFQFQNLDQSNLSNLVANQNSNVGVRFDGGSSGNDVRGIIGSNNLFHGLAILNGSNNNRMTQLKIFNNGSYGIHLTPNSSQNNLGFITVVNNIMDGIALSSTCSSNTIHSILSFNNQSAGVRIDSGSSNRLSHIVSASNSPAIFLNGSTNTLVQGLLMTDTPTCSVSGTGNELNASCMHGPAQAIPPVVANASNAILAGVSTDSVNSQGAAGSSPYGSITDWVRFENLFRAWGQLAAGYPAAANRGRCVAGLSCQIWDLRIRNSDTSIFNRGITGTSLNPLYVDGAACPINGNQVMQPATGAAFLISAVETPFDVGLSNAGNGNGFCESNETCIFAPHVGAFYGQGTLNTQACVFQNGVVSGVTLHNYSQPGI